MSGKVMMVRVKAADCKSKPFRKSHKGSHLMFYNPDDDVVTLLQQRKPTNFHCKVIVEPNGPLTGTPFDPNKT